MTTHRLNGLFDTALNRNCASLTFYYRQYNGDFVVKHLGEIKLSQLPRIYKAFNPNYTPGANANAPLNPYQKRYKKSRKITIISRKIHGHMSKYDGKGRN